MEWMSELGELAANEMFAMSTDKITSLIERLGGKTHYSDSEDKLKVLTSSPVSHGSIYF
jgi:hypothetical protein